MMRVDYDIKGFRKEFKVSSNPSKKTRLTHSSGSANARIRILPYSTKKQNNIVEDYRALLGNFSRELGGFKPRKFDQEQYLKTIADKVDSDKKDTLIYLIKELFFEQQELILTHPIFFNYLPEGTGNEYKVAHFLAAVFYSDQIRGAIRDTYAKEPNNVLLSLLYDSLEELEKDEGGVEDNFKCLVPSLQKQFEEDFLFLLSNEELLIRYFQKLVTFYYFIYVTQLVLDLSRMFDEKASDLQPVYFYLDWEPRSAARDSYRQGWKMVKTKLDKLFAHVNCVGMINYITDQENRFDYLTYDRLKELVQELSAEERKHLAERIAQLNMEYKSCLNDVDWSGLNQPSSDDPLDNVKMLFQSISYQFERSVRKKPAGEFCDGYEELAKKFFLKKSGPLGYTLNLTQDDLIFLTKLCLKDQEKISLKNLFAGMERRGVFFDRMTQKQVIGLYEKLNLLEKKSDSGDAQYVKNIL